MARSPRRAAGATLIEALVALTLVGVALLSGLALFAVERHAVQRLAAHQEVTRRIASLLEEARAGLAPLDSTAPLAAAGADVPRLEAREPAPRIWLETVAADAPDLLRVRARAIYWVAGRRYERSVETLLYRP